MRTGSGSIFQRKYVDRKGIERVSPKLTLRYYVNGKRVEVPTGTEVLSEARSMLRRLVHDHTPQQGYSQQPETVYMGQLFDLLLENWKQQGKRSVYDLECRVEKRLRPHFGGMKAAEIGKELQPYIKSRLAAKPTPTNATINRELAAVRRALKLGAQQEPPLVLRVPYFPMLPENNARGGTLPKEAYPKVRDFLPTYARLAFVIAYHTGARKGEILKIKRVDVNVPAGRIELPGSNTKGKVPRYLPIYGEMGAEIANTILRSDPKCPFLIQNEGQPVFDFEKSWLTACTLAGVPDLLFHDLRRTAVTMMVEAGLSEKEAMEISGHRTRAVFDRYHIVSPQRLQELGSVLTKHLKAR